MTTGPWSDEEEFSSTGIVPSLQLSIKQILHTMQILDWSTMLKPVFFLSNLFFFNIEKSDIGQICFIFFFFTGTFKWVCLAQFYEYSKAILKFKHIFSFFE